MTLTTDMYFVLSNTDSGQNTEHCEIQLADFTQEIADNLDQGQQTDVIVMDFCKAFSKVDHHKLVHKLRGVDNILTLGRRTLRWLFRGYVGHDSYRPTHFTLLKWIPFTI